MLIASIARQFCLEEDPVEGVNHAPIDRLACLDGFVGHLLTPENPPPRQVIGGELDRE